MKKFMQDLIDEDQGGFIKERQAQDNIRRNLHIVGKGEGAVLVSIRKKIVFN